MKNTKSVIPKVRLTIEKLVFGGAGLARHQGVVVFVPYTAPGDVVDVEITQKRKNFWRGRLVEIVSPGPHRISPPCEYFGRCGGCDFQHLEYSEQLAQKQEFVKQALRKFSLADSAFYEPLASPKIYQYRNRIQVYSKGAQWFYSERASNQRIPISSCALAESPIAKTLEDRQIDLPEGRYELRNIEGRVESLPLGKDSAVIAAPFSQVNTLANRALLETVCQFALLPSKGLLTPPSFTDFIDLYSGSGNLFYPLLETLSSLSTATSVELNSDLIGRSQESLRLFEESSREKLNSHKMPKIKLVGSSAEEFLNALNLQPAPRLIVIDPPREGLSDQACKLLSGLEFDRLIYVSCDPQTLARDLGQILQSGRILRQVQVIDMFPQTTHVETVVVIDSAC